MEETTYLRACPFCGTIPEIDEVSLWDGKRGYKGCVMYDISCKRCGCHIDIHENDTIYRDKKTARKNAIEAWNRRLEKQ